MYAKWEDDRALALKMLNPTQKELEHGLELHRNSFVFDAYGFTPAGGGDSEKLSAVTAENGSRDEITAVKEEFTSLLSFRSDPGMRKMLRDAYEFAGVDCVFQNAGVEGNDVENMLKRLSCYTLLVDSLEELFERAPFPEKLEAIRSRGHKALYLTTNGVPLPSKLLSAEGALEYISVFFRLGVRMMHLTYNRRNLIGDGCAEKADGGLSEFGRMVIAEMNRAGVIPDVAHSGERTSFEAAVCSRKPVVASHAAAGRFSSHFRSKSDEVIEAIKKSGGYIGICAIPRFLAGECNICSMMDHIEYVARKFGVDHVAIGTDRSTTLSPVNFSGTLPSFRRIWESFWPDPGDGIKVTDEQFRSLGWLNWPCFTVGLVQRGFSDGEIRKIIGGNVLRVAQETLN